MKGANFRVIAESLNIPDGSEVLIEVPEVGRISNEERLKRLHQLFGAVKYQPELG